MRAIPYESSMAEAATACYNQIVAGLHHCYPTTAERLGPILAGECPAESMRDEKAWVVADGERIVAIAHAGLDDGAKELDGPRGSIRFIAHDVGHRAAGQTVLAAAEDYLIAFDVPEIVVAHQDHRWPCHHFEHAYMTDRLSHVEGLLGFHGYGRCAGEVYLDWPELEPPALPACGVKASFESEAHDEGTPKMRFVVRARQGGELIGECWHASCGANAPGTEAEDWALTTWLWVKEPWQGQRLGANLLARGLHELRRHGFKHGVISTSLTNYRAQMFYGNFGYHISDWTYGWVKRTEGS